MDRIKSCTLVNKGIEAVNNPDRNDIAAAELPMASSFGPNKTQTFVDKNLIVKPVEDAELPKIDTVRNRVSNKRVAESSNLQESDMISRQRLFQSKEESLKMNVRLEV